MGLFPYTCPKCGGGYKRCGSAECPESNCEGSQMCYEDNIVVYFDGTNGEKYYVDGLYDGYGRAVISEIPDIKIHCAEFKQYFRAWSVKDVYLSNAYICKSCFTGKLSKFDKIKKYIPKYTA